MTINNEEKVSGNEGRELQHVAKLIIAEYADQPDGGPLYVKVSYEPVTEDALAERVPQSFMAMHKIFQTVIAPLVTTESNSNAPSTTTHQ